METCSILMFIGTMVGMAMKMCSSNDMDGNEQLHLSPMDDILLFQRHLYAILEISGWAGMLATHGRCALSGDGHPTWLEKPSSAPPQGVVVWLSCYSAVVVPCFLN